MKQAYWICSNFPREIPRACGYEPRRFWVHSGATAYSDRFFPPNLCSSVRASLEKALQLSDDEDLFLLVDCCAACRRLADAIEASLPGRTFLLDLPRSGQGAEVLADEFRRLADFLERKSGRMLIQEDLQQAIAAANQQRAAWRALLQKKAAGLLSPLAYYRALHAQAIEEELPIELDSSRPGSAPIMLLGNSLDLESIWRMLEELHFVVVADDLCYGEKMDVIDVEEEVEPFLALALALLARTACPRTLQLKERWEELQKRARSCGVQGVIFCPTKYCDYYAYEVPILVPRLRAAGLPTLVLEMDYSQVSPEQLRTRLEAFRESL